MIGYINPIIVGLHAFKTLFKFCIRVDIGIKKITKNFPAVLHKAFKGIGGARGAALMQKNGTVCFRRF
jgi:hypothetical protein